MGKRELLKYFLVFLLISPDILIAQYKDLKFENYSRNDGLSSSAITSIIQDKEGFIWLGTWDCGLNRYDGYNFKHYKNIANENGTLSENHIICMYEDKSGIVWIGTMNGGLNKFDKNREVFTSFIHNTEDSNSISDNCVNYIYKDRKEVFWIGTNKGLDVFDEKSNKFIHYYKSQSDTNLTFTAGNPNAGVTTICEDKLGNLWFGTNEGLKRFDSEKKTTTYCKDVTGDTVNDNNSAVYCLYEDKEGTIWIGTKAGLIKLKYLNEENYSFKTYCFGKTKNISSISSIYMDTKGLLWIGTIGDGLYIFEQETEEFSNYKNNADDAHSLRNDKILGNSIFEDRSGNIWIGTKNGLSIYIKNKNIFNFYPFNEPIQLCSIFEDRKGNIWITGKDNFHIRDKSNIFRIKSYKMPHKSNISSGLVYAGFSDKSGVIWLGYHSMLNTYDPVTGKLKLFYDFSDSIASKNSFILLIFEDSESLLWISTTNGLWIINKERTNVHKCNIVGNDLAGHVYEDKSGMMWIPVLFKGLYKYDKKSDKFHNYRNNPSDPNSLSNNNISHLYDDGKGNLWIASTGGLDKLDLATNTFTHYNEKDGLADNYTVCILPDNSGNIWVATVSGISKFNPVTKTFRNYDIENGLQDNEFDDMGCKTSKGELFFKGVNGINYFFPDSIRENTYVPPVVITSFKIFDKKASLDKSIIKTDEIKLSYKENFFSFEFTALDFTNPKKNQYKYILEGVDKEWHNSGNIRTANYTNIDPGEYIFRVKGSNNDGVWNEVGASIKIIITPPWWTSWWFRACGILFIVGIIGFVFNKRLHSVKKEKKAQEEFTRQIISAHEDERKRIAGELHDSLSQNLLVIKNKAAFGFKEDDKILFNEISEISSSALQEVREISYNLHPYQLERLGLTKAIKSITERALKSTNIEFNNDLDIIDKTFNREEEIYIYRIIQECVNNIIKHSGATKAELTIKKEANEVLIIISDNGKGFDVSAVLSDKAKKGIGLMDISERARIFNGTVRFDSVSGKGTRFTMTIPLIIKNHTS